MQERGIKLWPDRFRDPDRTGLGRICGLAVVLLVHVALSLLYLSALPAFNWPDEPAHFNYVRRLAEGRGLDVMSSEAWAPAELERLKREHFLSVDPHDEAIARIRYEAHQPPLYYALAAVAYRLVASIDAIKIFNLALSCGVVVLTWLAARRFLPDKPLVWWAAALFTALLPMRCFMAVSVSNSVAAELLFALFVLAVARGLSPVAVGALVGVGLWVHSVLLLALPLYAAWLTFAARREATGLSGASVPWRSSMIAAALALAMWSPWLVRNAAASGADHPLSLVTGALDSDAAVTAALGEPRPRLALTEPQGLGEFAELLFKSFWGVFGWMEMFFGAWIQAFFVVLTLAPMLGLAVSIRDRTSPSPDASLSAPRLAWLALTAVLFLAAVVLYSLFDFQPQGRYLLTASTAFAILYGAGLVRGLGRATGPWLAVTSLGLLAVNLHGALHMVPWYLAR